MFRRTKASQDPSAETVSVAAGDRPAGQQKKGRPTPTRRDAEAAAKARAKASATATKKARGGRTVSTTSSQEIREGQKRGDERYLPPRDQGPVRRCVRDLVDARFNLAEVLLPVMFVIMILIYSGNTKLVSFGNALWSTMLIVVAVDTVWLISKVRRELGKRYPEESHKGAQFYAVLRTLQFRFLRIPKPQRRIGEKF